MRFKEISQKYKEGAVHSLGAQLLLYGKFLVKSPGAL